MPQLHFQDRRDMKKHSGNIFFWLLGPLPTYAQSAKISQRLLSSETICLRLQTLLKPDH